jgi:hypothetical protein
MGLVGGNGEQEREAIAAAKLSSFQVCSNDILNFLKIH